MRLLRHSARLAAIAALLAGPAAFVLAASPPASAASAAGHDGWVRIAHLSPKAPAMDMYLYPFGNPGHPTILKDVTYGDVSAYMAVSPGQYTLAMRGFGAPASSRPALVTTFMVSTGTAYTAAALGPDPGLRVEVLKDQMAAPTGRALVRVLQASLKEPRVSVRYGGDVLAQQLPFGSATSYAAVPPGAQTVRFTAPGEQAAEPVRLAPDTSSTIVVLDDPSGLKVDAITDAAGSQVMPTGGVDAGLGGTAARPPGDPVPWLVMIAAGALLAMTGFASLRRSGTAVRL
ncbi:MAG: DUF4397 domain-containing protein [Actinomycetota bacterium]|nr:DUF4397 domain-containing protein [Actinomycetota bacterium]